MLVKRVGKHGTQILWTHHYTVGKLFLVTVDTKWKSYSDHTKTFHSCWNETKYFFRHTNQEHHKSIKKQIPKVGKCFIVHDEILLLRLLIKMWKFLQHAPSKFDLKGDGNILFAINIPKSKPGNLNDWWNYYIKHKLIMIKILCNIQELWKMQKKMSNFW